VRPIAQNFTVLIEVGDANYDPVVTHSPIDLCHRADLLIRQTTDVIVRIVAHVFLGKTSSPNSAPRAPMRQEWSAFGPYTLQALLSFQLHRRDLSPPIPNTRASRAPPSRSARPAPRHLTRGREPPLLVSITIGSVRINRAPKRSCAAGGRGSGFFSFTELVEEAASLFFVGGVPPFNAREPVGAAESGHQDSPLALPLRVLLVAEGREAGRELSGDLGAIFGREGQAVERPFATLIEPEAVPQRVNRLAAAAEVGKDTLAGLAVDAFAFDKLGDAHATTFVVAVDPPDEHASWIPENGRRRFG
jgi:hypothetical protein